METKQLLEDWQNKKKEYEAQNKSFEEKIEKKRKQLERLEKRKQKLRYPHWIEHVLKPLGYEIEKKLEGYKFDDNLVTLGLGANCMMSFKKENEKTLFIAFRPIREDLEIIDYTKKDESYSTGSIGYMNGFHYGGILFDETITIDWIIDYMKKEKE